MNNIGNKQFLDQTGLRHVFELIKSYFEKYVSKDEFIKSELTISESLNDLNERIENIDVPDTSGFVTNNQLNEEVQRLDDKIDGIQIPDTSEFVTNSQLETEVQNLNDKIDNLDIECDVTSVNGQTGDVVIDIPDTSNFVTNGKLNEEVQRLDDKIDNLPTGSNLQAGNNITINGGKINADGYNYKNISGSGVTLTLNYGGDNIPSVHNAGGDYSTVCGYKCKTANGSTSANSFCGGDECIASHQDCFVYGEGLNTITDHETVIGKFNNYNNFTNWGNNKPLFEVGGGSSVSNRRTLFMVQKNTGIVFASSEFKVEGMGDFAEYFEWADGNPDNADRVGYMVQLNSEKIELAQNFTKCIGVISNTNSFTADSASLDWQGRYLKDEWGRIIYEETENGDKIAKENPEYDSTREYIPRMYRKEWSTVGLIGKVYVRQDGTLKVGGFAGCKNGIATDSTKGYRVIRIINENIALVLVK